MSAEEKLESQSFPRRRLFDKGASPPEVDSFLHSPDSARLTEMVKQRTASESQETYKLLQTICGEYLKDAQENHQKAIDMENRQAEMEVLDAQANFLQKVATQKSMKIEHLERELGRLERMLSLKAAEVEARDSEIAKKDQEIERLKQELATQQSMNVLLEKHGEDQVGAMRAVITHLKSWLETF